MREETERNYETMQKIRELADYWIKFIDDVGNECAYSDTFIFEIKDKVAEFQFPN